jgi:hypothetical protein
MKRALLVTLCAIAVCSLCFAGTVNAAKAGYSFIIFSGTTPTVDGKWTSTSEWTDAYQDRLYSGWTMTNNVWACKWSAASDFSSIWEHYLIEVVTDTTNDPGDFFQLCYDTLQDGGTAPQTDDILINYTGHSTLAVYEGTGTGWALFTGYTLGTDLTIANSTSDSPISASPHWIFEITVNKLGVFALQLNNNVRLAAYDASNPSAGILSWPPMSSADVPDDYGAGASDIGGGTIPEGLTVGVMVLLSSVAVIASIRYFRKQPRIKSAAK